MTLFHVGGPALPASVTWRRSALWPALFGFVASGCSSGPVPRATHRDCDSRCMEAPEAETYSSGELIDVNVGPNKIFNPYLKVNILECSDPGGPSDASTQERRQL